MFWKTGLTRKSTRFREQLRSLAEQWAAPDFVSLRKCAPKPLSRHEVALMTVWLCPVIKVTLGSDQVNHLKYQS
jgi:hypothetical protein